MILCSWSRLTCVGKGQDRRCLIKWAVSDSLPPQGAEQASHEHGMLVRRNRDRKGESRTCQR
eukprot:3932856-Alexandrium_andersonii.AAC.1